MLINIDNVSKRPTSPHPVLNLGFRIFFLGASAFAIITMLLWLLVLQGVVSFQGSLTLFFWHGHEMVFGYGLAVVAGFLLTAVKTWTNQPMPYGHKLFWVFAPWMIARLIWLALSIKTSAVMLFTALVFDMIFWGLTSFAVVHAVYRAKQTRQLAIVIKLLFLWLANLCFYIGVISNRTELQKLSLYFAFYLVIGLVFIIARRVLPFFIAKGIAVDHQGKPNGITIEQKNSELLDRLVLMGFLGFVLFGLLIDFPKIASAFAVVCVMANTLRIKNWYHQAIWKKPLLWSLLIAFFGMNVGLLLIAIAPFLDSSYVYSLGFHGLALFGIGLMTISMMARVSLGHTGRNIHQPPKTVSWMFALMVLSGVFRVFVPMFGGDYMVWIGISQVLWIVAFMLFFISYFGILSKPRTDGLFG